MPRRSTREESSPHCAAAAAPFERQAQSKSPQRATAAAAEAGRRASASEHAQASERGWEQAARSITVTRGGRT